MPHWVPRFIVMWRLSYVAAGLLAVAAEPDLHISQSPRRDRQNRFPAVRFSKGSIGFIVAAFAAVLVLVTSMVGATPILNAETGLPAADAVLIHSAAYTMFAPICTVLDALTLLSLQQHAAVLATVILLVIVWRMLRARSVRTSIFREVGAA